MRRILLVLTVALVMAAMVLAMAMPAFGQAADPCTTGDTPSAPPDVGGTPISPTPETPPGYGVQDQKERPGESNSPFTGPNHPGRCDNSL